jgi:hypothetical protein
MPETLKIFSAISAAMADVEAIGKDRRNQQQGFNFRGIDDVYNSMHNILSKHKIFTVPEILSVESTEKPSKSGGILFYEKYKIQYTFYADDGSSVKAVVIGIGMDSGDKAGNKAMSIAHKYALLQVFCIPTADEKDPDAESHEPKYTKPAPAPVAPVPAYIQPDKGILSLAQAVAPVPATPAPDNQGWSIGIVEKVEHKSGTTKSGKPWQRWGITIHDTIFGTFSETIGTAAQTLQGSTVRFKYEEDGKYKTLTAIEPVGREPGVD